jgi:hypothetical protein
MARILINRYRNVAIEINRKDKWSVLVIGWAPVRRIKVLNKDVDAEWKTFDSDLKSAINRMMNSTIEETALRELKLLLKENGDD